MKTVDPRKVIERILVFDRVRSAVDMENWRVPFNAALVGAHGATGVRVRTRALARHNDAAVQRPPGSLAGHPRNAPPPPTFAVSILRIIFVDNPVRPGRRGRRLSRGR